jgi:crotonobetainyl-CoA:carnitine CoA-transferase CaiB-like acyl-CoA transferase
MATKSFEEYCRDVFSYKNAFGKPEALKGYRVLSCTQYILGPSSASYLAELGAEVIKVELPRRGEPMRHTTPYNEPLLYPLSKQLPEKGTGLGFFGANYNEYFLSLDFHKEQAKEIMRMLAAKSDAFMENYRAGTFDRWGIGYRQLAKVNPRLVYQWMGGFGGWGPGRLRASYDILGQAQGGNFSITGLPPESEFYKGEGGIGFPSKHTIWIMDYWGGMTAAFQVISAWYWRDFVSGEGNFMEYSQVHGAQRHMDYSIPLYGRFGIVRQRWGNWDSELCVLGIVKCGKSSYPQSKNPQEQEEGYIALVAYHDDTFQNLMKVIGKTDLGNKYKDHGERVKPEGQIEIYSAIEKWAADKTKEDVKAALDKADIANQPVWNSKEVSEQQHYHDRGTIHWLDDPSYGDVLTQGFHVLLSETPGRIKWVFKPVGADNEYVLTKLCGLSQSDLKNLEADEII